MSTENRELSGLKLDDAMKKTIKESDWVAVVTGSGEKFHLIAVWNAVLLGDDSVGLFAGGMFVTAKNLEANPHIELLAVSKKGNAGYRFTGTGKMVNKKNVDAQIIEKMKKANTKFFDISHSILIVSIVSATKLI